MFKLLNLDVVNIILMLLSAVIAFFIPFELFLFVFAFLGPLHYLTEINWLHTKNYYTTAKNDYLLLVFILFIVGISIFSPLAVYFKKFLPILIAFAFFSAFGMQQFAKTKAKNVYYVIVLGISVLLFYFFTEKSEIIFSYLLPTLIHVFIFTGLFILVGALKRDNSLGKISLIIFVLCGGILLFAPVFSINQSISSYITTSYDSLKSINQILIGYFSNDSSNNVFTSVIGIKIMRFIAFAYTYHYLNWFSKTSVIQWHKTSKKMIILIIAIWTASVVVYLYDFRLGLKWLYLLSLAHVFLEFPLNFKTITLIKQQLKV